MHEIRCWGLYFSIWVSKSTPSSPIWGTASRSCTPSQEGKTDFQCFSNETPGHLRSDGVPSIRKIRNSSPSSESPSSRKKPNSVFMLIHAHTKSSSISIMHSEKYPETKARGWPARQRCSQRSRHRCRRSSERRQAGSRVPGTRV